ncbi:MAG: hypothetical protein GWP36_07080 [Bacteroidetes bacterium]|nr:hypothetical protein [Bacteroidota bacterium]
MTDKLDELRQTINQLDDEILALIDRRMRLSGDIIAAKHGVAAYRPGREAAVIERLAANAPDISNLAVMNIWRAIMSASTAQQDAGVTIAVHADAMPAAAWHYGGLFNLIKCADLVAVRTALTRNPGEGDPSDAGADLAIVPQAIEPELATWLIDDPDWVVISASPYFTGGSVPPAYIIGRTLADMVPDEISLIAVREGTAVRLEKQKGRHHDADLQDDYGDAVGRRLIGVIASAEKSD